MANEHWNVILSARFINSWENYYLEILMAAGILVYFINFFTGKSKNARVASAWFDAHKEWIHHSSLLDLI